ncbi:hypothetical protein [Haloactinomyces albus]|uniref:Uncharacterized protein n=1 Tax=Haloactinomyces albus TaxID=1352928 RepID=A0AAE3ZDJ2_9ACTN|nr:hypothetical protein [Haloactinomyces albus]MDR7301865.1 hypothetical protein [Haloactinomyces albus]
MKQTLVDQTKNQNETFAAIPREGEKLQDGRMAQIKVPEKGWVEDYHVDDIPVVGGWASDYEERQERFQATNDEADTVMRRYGAQTDGVIGRTPEFEQPAQDSTPSPQQPQQYGGSASGAMAGAHYSSGPSMGGGSPSSTSSAWASGAGAPAGGSYSPPVSSAPSANAPAGTGSAWTSPSGGAQPPGAVRGSDGMLYRQNPDGTWQRQNPHNGRWAPAPKGPSGAAGARGGGSALGGGRPGGGFGPRGSGGPLAAGGRAGSGSFGPTGGSSASGTAASGSGSGRGGMMRGGPMAGAGGQQGQGDAEEEHERPTWLVESEDVFTNDMDRVAPPVLGALPHEEQGR